MVQRIYVVSGENQTILVQAANQAQALRHVAGSRYVIQAAKPMDVAILMTEGIKLEVAHQEEDPSQQNMFGEEQGI